MIFIGQASNYHFGRTLKHLLTRGSAKKTLLLRQTLAKRYRVVKDKKSGNFGTAAGELVCETPEDRVALYHSGRSALTAAITATVPKGSKVLVQGLTCIAVVRAVRAAGCEPVFIDVDRETLQFDLKKLAKTLKKEKDIAAIIIQNTLGLTIDITEVEKLAKESDLVIIEDLAHSAGRFYLDRREAGTVGAATVLSFGKGKAIDTISGGALVLRQPEFVIPNQPALLPSRSDRRRDRWYPVLGAFMRLGYRLHIPKLVTGLFLKLHWIERSADAKLDLDIKLPDWQAKLALKQLAHLSRTPLREHAFVRDRSKVLGLLRKNGYYLDEIWYDTPVSPLRYQKEAQFPTKTCPVTVQVAKEIVNLPTWYPEAKLERARKLISVYEVGGVNDEILGELDDAA